MQKHVNLVDLVKSFPTNIYLQNLASIQTRTNPVKFAHLAEKSGKGSISNISTKAGGVALAWGSADSVGVPLPTEKQEFPVFVEQLETLVESQRCFAGHTQSYILAQMPQKSVFKLDGYTLPALGASAPGPP